MVGVGLVAYVEAQLEQDIALGRLPRNGRLASERVMARWYGVSRGTVREALRRLAARGLVVQHPGRQARAVSLDESLTLENLGLALHDPRSEECRRLLEGFFSLKRQVLVELLVDCCVKASGSQVEQLESVCYALRDAARWHPGERCAQLEFELLRLAAQAAARPGHLLLIQSLQRAFRGIEARLLPFMGGESLHQWAMHAMHALSERDAQALQHQLPTLLEVCDELVLDQFAPLPQEQVSPEAPQAQEGSLGAPASAHHQAGPLEARPCVDALDLGTPAPAAEPTEALGAAPRARGAVLPREQVGGAQLLPSAPESHLRETGGDCVQDGATPSAAEGPQPEPQDPPPPTTGPKGGAPLSASLPTTWEPPAS
ncbi:GntR family transcriptional regulator [Corallococcus exercitus]|uniref:GntR family transcriptional regulator n=1 Tax=Corallococcus exercitus TaxID=2316736 RepID=A0A7Y4JXP9_9BACT|nr:GntR family transcriptional regulator [Corallococcus exercitus]NOK12167.1 GntR family transcriptional regulator [Corallococcus exercitus]